MATIAPATRPAAFPIESGRRRASRSRRKPVIQRMSIRMIPSWTSVSIPVDHSYSTRRVGFPPAERLVELRVRMRELERGQGELVVTIGGNGGGYAAGDLNEMRTELAGLADAAIACVERLEDVGV